MFFKKLYETKKSPQELAGVKKKSFAITFAGGELWAEHLDGMYQYTDLVIEKLRKDSLTFSRPSAPSQIAVNLDETIFKPEIAAAIAECFLITKKRFTRIAFIGLAQKDQKALKSTLRKTAEIPFALSFFDDYEKAKEWLIAER